MTTHNLKLYVTEPMEFFKNITFPSASGPQRFEDVMAPHQEKWFSDISPSLLAIANHEKPPIGKFWSERTKGGSKDSDAACVLLWLLAFCCIKLDMQVGAADRDQAAELKKAAVDILRLNPFLARRIEAQSWTLICKATGSECSIVAADVAGSHGARPDITLVNELSHITKEEFAANLMDNATKKPNGLIIICTNAGFTGSWQERWRETASNSENWNFHSLQEPAPWLSDSEIEEAQQRNSAARFSRLFWGQWVSQSGDALDEADIKAALTAFGPLKYPPPDDKFFYVAGIDLGIKQDHSALVVLQGDRHTLQFRMVEAISWKPNSATGKVSLIEVEEAVLDAHQRYQLTVAGYDPYQAALMAQRLELQHVPMQEMTFTGANLNLMASTLLDTFRSRRISLWDHTALVKDLSRLTIEEKTYGYRLSATRNESGHADLATALAIALPLAAEEAGEVPIVAGAMFSNTEDDEILSIRQVWSRIILENE